MIAQYCESFGQDPDKVFDKVSFGTVTNFAVYFKDRDEYQERYSYIWQTINADGPKDNK